ncbi:hypothetical protein [Dryocola sp. BD613]|uniref:hypothetical protein n=1 Tax=Dryocola sp. BD613 TaxID=3133272 RepID=UPI003F4F5FA4
MSEKSLILAAGDNEVITDIIAENLQRDGFLALPSKNGAHALEFYTQFLRALSIPDIDIP